MFLNGCSSQAKILDIGIGNGYALCCNKEIVKSKNLSIKGIDICIDSLNECLDNLYDYDLKKEVSVELIQCKQLVRKTINHRRHNNVSDVKNNFEEKKEYDCAFLSNSYSVIDNSWEVIKDALFISNKVYVSLTLFDSNNIIINFIKPKLKYILGFDFGRFLTVKSFIKEINDAGLECKNIYTLDGSNFWLFGLIPIYQVEVVKKQTHLE